MHLNKEKIAEWLEKIYADDYFLSDHISSPITVNRFEQSNNKLVINYEYWDDGHANEGAQEYFLFDLKAAEEYGVNVPAYMQLIKMNVEYTWISKDDCESLNDNISDQLENVEEVLCYKWDDPEIEDFIETYIDQDKENLKDLLINYYDAKNGIPEFIPDKLKPYFKKLISSP